MSLLCVFFFLFTPLSLCAVKIALFLCVCPQSTPLWMTPGAKFRKMVSANNFTLRQISMSLVIFYIFVSFFDLTGKICIAFFECLVFFWGFFCLISCNDFCSPNPKKMCFFVRVCLLKKIYFTTALPLSVSVTRFLSLIFSCATGPFCLCIPAFNTELQIDVSSSEIRLFLT